MQLARVGRAVGRVSVRGPSAAVCPCAGRVAAVMSAAGMTVLYPRNGDDWAGHIDQEERLLYPKLLAASGSDPVVVQAVRRWQVDHQLYTALLRAGRPLPTGLAPHSVDVHGREEDALVWRYRAGIAPGVATAGVRVGATASPPPVIDASSLVADLQAAAAKDNATYAATKASTEAKYKEYGADLAPFTAGYSVILAQAVVEVIDTMSSIAKLIGGDDNSKDWQDRAVNAISGAIDRGWIPHKFRSDIESAKSYALYVESGNSSFDSTIPQSYRDAYRTAIQSPVVQEAAKRAQGGWDGGGHSGKDASIPGQFCTPDASGVPKEGTSAPMPTFLAAVSAYSGGPTLTDAANIAYQRYLLPGTCSNDPMEGWVYHRDAWANLQAAGPASVVGTVGTIAVLTAIGWGIWRFVL